MIKPFNQLHLKILALFAAVALWFIVITVENTVYKFPEQIDITVENLGKNISLESALPSVDIYLRVDKEDLKKISATDLTAEIDLSEAKAGEQTVKIMAASKSPLAQVLKVDPSEVKIKLSPVVEKEVAVQIIVEGSPAQGYEVAKTESETGTVVVSGAQSIIDRIESIDAKIILDGTQKDDLNQSVQLSVPGDLNIDPGLVAFTPAEMIVNIEIVSAVNEKDVPVQVTFINENDRAAFESRLQVSPQSIKLKGPHGDLDRIQTVKTQALEISALVRNGTVDARLELPENIELADPSQTVKITLKDNGLGDEPTI